MKKLLKNIDNQIEFNKGKNLFNDGPNNALMFIKDTISTVENMDHFTIESEQSVIDYATNKALQEFCRVNQYYSFNNEAIQNLRNIYADLFLGIRNKISSADQISKTHYNNLAKWLKKTNPFAENTYSYNDLTLKPVACSEYSAELQIEILQIDLSNILEPVLDIGSGKQGVLVNHLHRFGIDATGIDRFSLNSKHLINANWLEFDYGLKKWGTIISNLGFSNHFNHHHLRQDGDFTGYALKYMEILNSLKPGGTFHYAPDLPFIELYLDQKTYQLSNIKIGKFDYKTTIITRLK